MTDLRIDPVAVAEFRSEATHAEGSICVRLRGTADIPARAALDTVLSQLHSESQRLKVAGVVVDLTQLEFMNSSCFKSFVAWIEQVQNLDPTEQYRIQFLSDPNMHWQRRSLKALSCFAADLITVEC
jgi:anti-anti-sigma factor